MNSSNFASQLNINPNADRYALIDPHISVLSRSQTQANFSQMEPCLIFDKIIHQATQFEAYQVAEQLRSVVPSVDLLELSKILFKVYQWSVVREVFGESLNYRTLANAFREVKLNTDIDNLRKELIWTLCQHLNPSNLAERESFLKACRFYSELIQVIYPDSGSQLILFAKILYQQDLVVCQSTGTMADAAASIGSDNAIQLSSKVSFEDSFFCDLCQEFILFEKIDYKSLDLFFDFLSQLEPKLKERILFMQGDLIVNYLQIVETPEIKGKLHLGSWFQKMDIIKYLILDSQDMGEFFCHYFLKQVYLLDIATEQDERLVLGLYQELFFKDLANGPLGFLALVLKGSYLNIEDSVQMLQNFGSLEMFDTKLYVKACDYVYQFEGTVRVIDRALSLMNFSSANPMISTKFEMLIHSRSSTISKILFEQLIEDPKFCEMRYGIRLKSFVDSVCQHNLFSLEEKLFYVNKMLNIFSPPFENYQNWIMLTLKSHACDRFIRQEDKSKLMDLLCDPRILDDKDYLDSIQIWVSSMMLRPLASLNPLAILEIGVDEFRCQMMEMDKNAFILSSAYELSWNEILSETNFAWAIVINEAIHKLNQLKSVHGHFSGFQGGFRNLHSIHAKSRLDDFIPQLQEIMDGLYSMLDISQQAVIRQQRAWNSRVNRHYTNTF